MSRITAGERRGLILLIIVMIVATVILCWRDCATSCPCSAHDGAVPESTVSDIADSLASSTLSDSVNARGTRRHKRGAVTKPSGQKQRAFPPRNPRDEKVN